MQHEARLYRRSCFAISSTPSANTTLSAHSPSSAASTPGSLMTCAHDTSSSLYIKASTRQEPGLVVIGESPGRRLHGAHPCGHHERKCPESLAIYRA